VGPYLFATHLWAEPPALLLLAIAAIPIIEKHLVTWWIHSFINSFAMVGT
jgi:hypothetical protein